MSVNKIEEALKLSLAQAVEKAGLVDHQDPQTIVIEILKIHKTVTTHPILRCN